MPETPKNYNCNTLNELWMGFDWVRYNVFIDKFPQLIHTVYGRKQIEIAYGKM